MPVDIQGKAWKTKTRDIGATENGFKFNTEDTFFPEIRVNFVQSWRGQIWTIFLPLSVTNYSTATKMCSLHRRVFADFTHNLRAVNDWIYFDCVEANPAVSQNSSQHSGTHILSKFKPKQKLNYKPSIATFRSIKGIGIIPAT